MIPKNVTPEEKRMAWENLKAFMELSRRYDIHMATSNSGAVAKSAAPNFSKVRV